jgi:hypothetical protein
MPGSEIVPPIRRFFFNLIGALGIAFGVRKGKARKRLKKQD